MKRPFVLALTALACACASTRRYDCDGAELTAADASIRVGDATAPWSRRGEDGDHYVLRTPETVREFVLPPDRHLDATLTVDQHGHSTCVAAGGYTDALRRFMKGASVDRARGCASSRAADR